MKLWTSVEFTRLPAILKNGFDNPYAAEITFSNSPEIEAENALSMPGELAFIEAEIPDDQLDNYFMDCIGLWGDDLTNMEADLEYLMERGGSQKEIEGLQKLIERGGAVRTVIEGIEVFGYV